MMQAFTPLSGSVSNVCGCNFKDRKLAAFVLSLVLFFSSFEAVNAVLPSYLPALGVAYHGRHSLVQQYFDLGLNYVEIISFLLLVHGASLSLRRLKRILRSRVESTTFSTHPQSPDALYLQSLAQIDFRYDESTARDTIRVDSIESCRIDNIFNPPSKPRCAIFTKSRANRLPV